METRASNIAVGAFVLVLLVGAIGFIFWVGHFSERVAIDRPFLHPLLPARSRGWTSNSNVLFGGIPIGHVTSVEVDPQRSSLARVDIRSRLGTPIRTDSEATLAMQGITGGVLVEISRGTKTARAVEDRTPRFPRPIRRSSAC